MSVARLMQQRLLSVCAVCVLSLSGCDQSSMNGAESSSGMTIVRTTSGEVKGVVDDNILTFKGIPYAAPPLGERRWAPPQPMPAWEGVRDASRFGSDCMQEPFPEDAAPLETQPNEDCLVLNIWRKNKLVSEALPVLFWIHGGGFVNGGSSPRVYDGRAFAEQDIVFVSFNYRLGRFGFFAHPAVTAEAMGLLGNYGYMDQIAALEWVRDNIANFGGNPNDVTIMGESAGGFSVLNLMTAKQSQGLFHKAIIMSGGGRSIMGGMRSLRDSDDKHPSGEEIGMNFAALHGIEGEGAEALAALRALSAEDVTLQLNLAQLFSPETGPQTYVDGPMLDGEMMLSQPGRVIEGGEAARIPVLIGTTHRDIGWLDAETKEDIFSHFGDMADEVRKAYDPWGDLPMEALQAMLGADVAMHESAHFTAREITKYGHDAWIYRFSYVAESKRAEWPSAPHASEIPFVFHTVKAKYGDALTAQDARVAANALQAFSNFVTTGNPNSTGKNVWPTYQGAHGPIMEFDMNGDATVKDDPWQARLSVLTRFLDTQ
ncbi:MAG TPA: carboxylesterase family protein [Pseudomonadales bacterium]|nr:carboxylesterase family protein [Pseudomonadales bacterium]